MNKERTEEYRLEVEEEEEVMNIEDKDIWDA